MRRLHDASDATGGKHGQMVGTDEGDSREQPDAGDQHWMAGYEGPWFSGLSCPTCGALVGNREQYAVLHRRWHDSVEVRATR
jgi:hypothetical protein